MPTITAMIRPAISILSPVLTPLSDPKPTGIGIALVGVTDIQYVSLLRSIFTVNGHIPRAATDTIIIPQLPRMILDMLDDSHE